MSAEAVWRRDFGPQPLRFMEAFRASHRLTPREAEILFYLCCGLTERKRLVRLLCMAEDTLNNHRTHLYRKLGVPDCTGAVLRAWPVFVAATQGRGR